MTRFLARLGDTCMVIAVFPLVLVVGGFVILIIPALVVGGTLMLIGYDFSWVEPAWMAWQSAIPESTKIGLKLIYAGFASGGLIRMIVRLR